MSDKQARGYWVPFIKALMLHLLVFGLFVFNWESVEKHPIVAQSVIVQAQVLVLENPVMGRKEKEEDKQKAEDARKAQEKRKAEDAQKAQEKRKAEDAQKAQEKRKAEDAQKAQEKRKAEDAQKAQEKRKAEDAQKAQEKRKAEDAQKALEKRKAEDKRKADQQLAEQRRKKEQADEARDRELDISRALSDESEYQQSQTNAQLSGSYIGLIQGRIIENWHRPLSARNGMQAIVMIQLVPTGEVQNVYLVESSGDAAFDRSVIQAVQRAGKFEELQRLTPSQFNANFRKFRIIFKPEDLIR